MKGIIIMKLTIKRSVLLELVESVYEAIPPQSSDPCYKNYLLTISNSGIDLLGSDNYEKNSNNSCNNSMYIIFK